MFKLVRFFLFLLIVASVSLTALLYFASSPLLESFLTKKLGTKVTMQNSKVRLDSITLYNVAISSALTADIITISSTPLKLLAGTIEELHITSPHIHLELFNPSGTSSNWSALLSQLPPTRTLTVHKTIATNISLTAQKANGKQLNFPLFPYLEMEETTSSEITKSVLQSLIAPYTANKPLKNILSNVEPTPQPNFVNKIKSKTGDGLNKLYDLLPDWATLP